MKIEFRATDGMNSKTRTLETLQVLFIFAGYDSGKRGRKEAFRFGISESHYNRIGSRKAWAGLDAKLKQLKR